MKQYHRYLILEEDFSKGFLSLKDHSVYVYVIYSWLSAPAFENEMETYYGNPLV